MTVGKTAGFLKLTATGSLRQAWLSPAKSERCQFCRRVLHPRGPSGLKCQTAPLSCRGLEKETAAASRSHGPLKSEWRGLGIRCRLRELLLPETRKLIYIRIGWRLRPLRVLWIWGIKHNGFHVALSFTTPRLHRGTVCSLESGSDLFCS